MSLPTLVKSWEFNPNIAIAATGTALGTNRTILKAIKDTLLSTSNWVNGNNSLITPANMWTTRYSCDSVVAGSAGDGVDRWDAITDLVWANAGTAHSWYVLRQTNIDTNCELLISCENNSGSGNSLTVVFSPSAGFTGGTTTARPTATDEIIVINTTTWGGVVTTDSNVKLHFMKSSDGQVWRVFCANGGQINTCWIIEKAVSLIGASWANKGVMFAQGTSPATSVLTQSFLYNNPYFNARGANAMTMYLSGMSNGLGVLNVVATTANDLSTNWPFLPQQLYSNTASNKGAHGYLNDVWYGSTTTASGSTAPTTGTQHQFVQLGSLIFPWCEIAIIMS